MIEAGLELGYSATNLYLNLLLCLAPRVLVADQACSRPISPWRSILAGPTDANDMARMVIHDVCEKVSIVSPNALLATFVDDASLLHTGSDEEVVLPSARAARALALMLGACASESEASEWLECWKASEATAVHRERLRIS